MGKQCRIIHLIMESFRVAVFVSSLVLFCSVASRGLEVRSNDDPATPCTDANCKLPDCFCSGTKAPNDIPGERVPQFIMLTFDDSINPYVHQFYEKLFNPARKNPVMCEIDLKPRDAGEYSGSGGAETIPCQMPSMKDWTCINKEGRRVVKDEKSGAANGKEGRPLVCEESEKRSCVLDR